MIYRTWHIAFCNIIIPLPDDYPGTIRVILRVRVLPSCSHTFLCLVLVEVKALVVYHLYGETGWSMVCANGKQNSY